MADDIRTIVVVNGEEYQVTKFTAVTGLQIARLVLAKFAPIIPLVSGKGNMGTEDMLAIVGSAIESVSDDDIEVLVKKCLRVCKKKLKSGHVACIDENGNYGIEGLEHDLITTIMLVVEAIKWGAGDFFGEKASALLQQFMPASKQSEA